MTLFLNFNQKILYPRIFIYTRVLKVRLTYIILNINNFRKKYKIAKMPFRSWADMVEEDDNELVPIWYIEDGDCHLDFEEMYEITKSFDNSKKSGWGIGYFLNYHYGEYKFN